MKKVWLANLLLLTFIACEPANEYNIGSANPEVEVITLSSLTAQANSFQGKEVRLNGYLEYEFENVALYPKKDGERGKAVWLNFDSLEINDQVLEELNGKAISVFGIFDKKLKGHLGLYTGTVTVKHLEAK